MSISRRRRIPLPKWPHRCAPTVDVLYATDRRVEPQEDGTLASGYERSASLAFGSCLVEIGENLAWETLVEQSLRRERSQPLPLHIRTITEQGRFPATPLPIVRGNGHFQTAPAAQAAQEQMTETLRQNSARIWRSVAGHISLTPECPRAFSGIRISMGSRR